MKKICLVIIYLGIFLGSCKSQSSSNEIERSKNFMRKAIATLDSGHVLRRLADTLRYERAIAFLDTAIYLNTDNYLAYWKASELLCQLNHYKKALTLISKYTEKHSDNFDFLLQEACLYDKMGDVNSAKSNYKVILSKINFQLESTHDDKKLMITKLMLLFLLEDIGAREYLHTLNINFPNDSMVNFYTKYFSNFSKEKFLNYQLARSTEAINLK